MIGCIVQARMGSSRLSGKVMMMVDPNLHVIDYVLNQLKATKLIDEIIVATSTQKQDEKIINHLKLILPMRKEILIIINCASNC